MGGIGIVINRQWCGVVPLLILSNSQDYAIVWQNHCICNVKVSCVTVTHYHKPELAGNFRLAQSGRVLVSQPGFECHLDPGIFLCYMNFLCLIEEKCPPNQCSLYSGLPAVYLVIPILALCNQCAGLSVSNHQLIGTWWYVSRMFTKLLVWWFRSFSPQLLLALSYNCIHYSQQPEFHRLTRRWLRLFVLHWNFVVQTHSTVCFV
jgi:hypothetical protein